MTVRGIRQTGGAIKQYVEVGVTPKWTAISPERPSQRTAKMTACCPSVQVDRELNQGGGSDIEGLGW